MRRFVHIVLVLSTTLVLAGCASRRMDLTRSSTQLDVGVRAARENLWREALFRFQRAVQIDPANAMAQNNLAVAYEGIGEFDKAREHYAAALNLDRSNQYIQKNYSRFVEFYTKNRKRERAVVATAAVKEEPQPKPSPPTETAAAPPDLSPPPSEPAVVPAAAPEEPVKPVSSPPDVAKPDKPPGGGVR